MEDSENIFTEQELEALTALYKGGNTHDFGFMIFQKARENSGSTDFSDEYYNESIAPMLEDTLDNPIFGMLPTDNLIGILYMSISTALSTGETAEETDN